MVPSAAAAIGPQARTVCPATRTREQPHADWFPACVRCGRGRGGSGLGGGRRTAPGAGGSWPASGPCSDSPAHASARRSWRLVVVVTAVVGGGKFAEAPLRGRQDAADRIPALSSRAGPGGTVSRPRPGHWCSFAESFAGLAPSRPARSARRSIKPQRPESPDQASRETA